MSDEPDGLDPVNHGELMLRILEQLRDEIRANRDETRSAREESRAGHDVLRTEVRALAASFTERMDRGDLRMDAMEQTLRELAAQQRATVSFLRERVIPDLADLRQRMTVLEAR